MTPLEEIKKMLGKSGFPVAYHSFPEGEAPAMPYIIYITPYSNNFKADGKVYSSSRHIQIELYTRHKDMHAEERLRKCWKRFITKKMKLDLTAKAAMKSYTNWRRRNVK